MLIFALSAPAILSVFEWAISLGHKTEANARGSHFQANFGAVKPKSHFYGNVIQDTGISDNQNLVVYIASQTFNIGVEVKHTGAFTYELWFRDGLGPT